MLPTIDESSKMPITDETVKHVIYKKQLNEAIKLLVDIVYDGSIICLPPKEHVKKIKKLADDFLTKNNLYGGIK